MIRRFILRWAARAISSQRKDPRDAIRAKARQMYIAQGKDVPAVLRG